MLEHPWYIFVLTLDADSWDVINGVLRLMSISFLTYTDTSTHWFPEPFNDDGTWRETQFYQVLNTTYIPIALNAARTADPHAKLYINEYNITGPGPPFPSPPRAPSSHVSTGPKATSMKNLVRALKAAHVPLDGVGVQAHEVVGEVPPAHAIARNLAELAALAGEVAITELDVRFNTLPPSVEGLEQQRRDYETIVGACAVVPGCVGVTVWDFTDKVGVRERWVCRRLMLRDMWQYSWIPGTFPESGDACPWDDVSALVSSSTLGC